MSKQTSISLHLATVMGLAGARCGTEDLGGSGKVYTDSGVFNPFTSRAQWADVVPWYVRREAMLHLTYLSARCPATETEIGCSNSDDSRMAATLEAIALATAWAG